MISRFFCFVVLFKLMSASALLASHNYDYEIHASCHNSTSGTSDAEGEFNI